MWKLLLIKGVKSPSKKNSFFQRILPYWAGFSGYRCFSLCLTVFLSPILKVQCPNFFWFPESLGKSNEKEWYQIWKLLLIKGVKSPQQNKFFTDFFHLFTQFKRLFVPTSQSPMSKHIRFLESLGKSNAQNWSQLFLNFS